MEEKIPHKIFLFKNPITEDCDYRWLSQRSCNEDIEYVNIDIVCKALQETMYEARMFQGRLHHDEVINNFINSFKQKLI